MLYGKIHNGELVYANNIIESEGKKIINPTAETLISLGYLPVIMSQQPEYDEFYRVVSKWEQRESEIVRVWELIPIDYGQAVDCEIRKRYSISEEFAILRQKEQKPEEYMEYFSYCEKCKDYVKSKLAEHLAEEKARQERELDNENIH